MTEFYNQEIFDGEHIVVTGGGTGLGKAMAQRFASLGAAVTICGRREEPLIETAKEIKDAGGQAEAISCNLKEHEAVEAALKKILPKLEKGKPERLWAEDILLDLGH